MKSKMSAMRDVYVVLLCFLLSSHHLNFTDAHGYMSSPRSRNWFAAEDGTNGQETGLPKKEFCPHCLNRKGASENCGIGQNGSYDVYNDSGNKKMPWISQETYDDGATITVSGVLTANHGGHIEVFACANPNPSSKCLKTNPLTMIKDNLFNGPNDSVYPVRGYLSPAMKFSFLYKLPSGLNGEKVIIQWHYITANSCHPLGYKNPDLRLAERGWLRGPNLKSCGDYSDTGVGMPEQFWNCAEVTILDNGSPTAPTTSVPTKFTTKSPTKATKAPIPVPPTSPTTKAPTSPTTKAPTKSTQGYCSWSTPRCNGIDSSPWCSVSRDRCVNQCGNGTWCGANPPKSTPLPTMSPPPTSLTPPTSDPKFATTTRYWDCSGGACGCAYLPFGKADEPAMCYSNAMFKAPSNNSYGATYYGTAAISQGLGGGDWLAEGCGKCWKVTGKSNAPGYEGVESTLVLKGSNFCPPGNAMCEGSNPHFDISAPGFDVTEYSFANTCNKREPEEKEGFAACGRWLIDSENPDENCDCSKFKDPVLRAGCDNFFSLKWDNAPVAYEEVNCPAELSRLNCWEENGNGYPDDVPEFCASNYPSTPCGNGIVGNGVCEDDTLCCSEWGWCGSSSAHCKTKAPVQAPVAPPPTAPTVPTTKAPSGSSDGDDSRLIAYLGNWHTCPSIDRVSKYTHIVIAFAVSYTWSPSKNQCSTTCEIDEPPVCNNNANPNLIAEWQKAGKKVILSFGGAGMGGSWDGDNNDCWEYCFGKEDQVVDRLVEIVDGMGLDGVDLDYEYFYEDNQNNSGFTKGKEAQKFLTDVTLGLREKLPNDSEVTHAPMDSDMVPGKAYYDVLVKVGSSLNYLMPQYYNGVTRPVIDGVDGTGSGSVSALSHYTTVIKNVFDGDATRMVFGFCINDCSGTGSNANGQQAAKVMVDLAKTYDCNGGAFFWVADDDSNGRWSETVSAVIEPNAGCAATLSPTATSTTMTPSAAPSTNSCSEDKSENFVHSLNKSGKLKTKNCKWLQKKGVKALSYCKKKVAVTEDINSPQYTCRVTCDSCDPCYQNKKSKFFYKKNKKGKVLLKDCKWLEKVKNPGSICKKTGSNAGYGPASSVCPKVCSDDCK